MPTLRVSEPVRRYLRDLAKESGESMQSVLEKAVEAYRRQRLLDDTDRAYRALRDDRQGWEDEAGERSAWEATLGDDLGED